MAKAVELIRYLRVAGGTGFAFVLFGMSGLVLNGVILLIGWIPVPSPETKAWAMQKVVHYAFRGFMGYLRGFDLVLGKAEGLEKLPNSGPYILVANHPTLLDVVLILASIPRACCIVKPEILDSIYMRGVSRLAGYIPKTGGEQLIDACVDKLNQGIPLVIFPEGTRSLLNELGEFKRLAAGISLKSGFPIVRTVVQCGSPILMKQWKWYNVPPHSTELRFKIYDTINPTDFLAGQSCGPIPARRLTDHLRRFYEGELHGTSFA